MGGKIYGTKKSKEWREEPLGTMSYQTSSKRSPPFWLLIGARKTQVFWHQSEARTAATVWNWSGKTLSPGALLAVLYFSSFHIYFPARLDFPSPPLSAPGSPRMDIYSQGLLRVAVCKDRESAVTDPFGESLIFCLKLALSRLFSKIIFKSSNDFVYFGNLGKIKLRSNCGQSAVFWLIKRCYDQPPPKS